MRARDRRREEMMKKVERRTIPRCQPLLQTHPSPSFSRTSKTSSGCLVRLSSLSFFNFLHPGRRGGGDRKRERDRVIEREGREGELGEREEVIV